MHHLLLIFLLLLPHDSLAEPLSIEQQQRTEALFKEVRCPTCEGQSLHDSDSPLSHDIRLMITQQVQAGKTDREILDGLKDSYGESVLLKPGRGHWLLWGAPFLSLLIGFTILLISISNRKKT